MSTLLRPPFLTSLKILEEAAMMGVQILEGDWNADVTAAAAASGKDANKTKNPSARQRRWTAFRSWYRGGRVFDRADQTLIAAAMLRRPPSPGSQGRPLTPRMTPADGPRPAAPFSTEQDGGETSDAVPAAAAAAAPAPAPANPTGSDYVPVAAAAASEEAVLSEAVKGMVPRPDAGSVTPPAGVMQGRRTTPPAPPVPPGVVATFHVTLLKSDQPAPARVSNLGGGDGGADEPVGATGGEVRAQEKLDGDTDAAQLAGIEGWDAGEGEGNDSFVMVSEGVAVGRLGPGADEGRGGDGDSRAGGAGVEIAEGLPPASREGGTGAAKRLRMEARRKFLAARTTSSKQAARKVSSHAVCAVCAML